MRTRLVLGRLLPLTAAAYLLPGNPSAHAQALDFAALSDSLGIASDTTLGFAQARRGQIALAGQTHQEARSARSSAKGGATYDLVTAARITIFPKAFGFAGSPLRLQAEVSAQRFIGGGASGAFCEG